jgi:hypothetical protein
MAQRGRPMWRMNSDGSLTVYAYTPQFGGVGVTHSQRIAPGTAIGDVPWQYRSQVRSAHAEGWDRPPEYEAALWKVRHTIRTVSVLLGVAFVVLVLALGHHHGIR